MPSGNLRPIPALSAEFDARAWAGVNVFDRGASTVTLSASAGVYDDVLAMLHGFGSQSTRKLATDLAAGWTGGGTATCGIDADDFFYIESSTTDFTIAASAGNAQWGLSAAGHSTVGGSAPFRRTATEPWTRGVFTCNKGAGTTLTLDPSGAGASFDFPARNFAAQSLPTAIRGAEGDADDGVALSLETADNDGADNATRRIRWGVDATGRVYYTRPSSVAAAITWVSTTFRDRLGFTGLEAEVTANSVSTLTATHPCPGFLVPPYPFEECARTRRETTNAINLSSSLIARNEVAVVLGWDVAMKLGGPAMATDLSRHWLERFMRYCPLGSRVRVYREWGDPRRALDPWEVVTGTSAYTHYHTSERSGTIGARRCRRLSTDTAEHSIRFPTRVQTLLDVAMRLQDAE